MAVSEQILQSRLSSLPADDRLLPVQNGRELFRFSFDKTARPESAENDFRIHIAALDGKVSDEIWYSDSPVGHGTDGAFRFSECERFLAAHIEIDLHDVADFKSLTTRVYSELLQLIKQRGYPHLVRVWNYFPGINTGHGDAELYRLFTAGRAVAYGAFAHEGGVLPAATAIGTDPGTPLTITAIAARENCRTIENPRQTSAYEYPREYGPVSPSFSRAVVVSSVAGHRILISGTASIVGHRSLHPDDPCGQVTETLRNLDDLVRYARSVFGSRKDDPRILADGSLRVYLRNPADVTRVEQALRAVVGQGVSIIFLRGDICRRELLLEIEAAGDI